MSSRAACRASARTSANRAGLSFPRLSISPVPTRSSRFGCWHAAGAAGVALGAEPSEGAPASARDCRRCIRRAPGLGLYPSPEDLNLTVGWCPMASSNSAPSMPIRRFSRLCATWPCRASGWACTRLCMARPTAFSTTANRCSRFMSSSPARHRQSEPMNYQARGCLANQPYSSAAAGSADNAGLAVVRPV